MYLMSLKLFKSAPTVGFPLNKNDKSTDKCKPIAFYSFYPFFNLLISYLTL